MDLRFYIIPASHPCEAVMRAADYKGLAYSKTALVPPMHRLQMIAAFGDRTVPAMKAGDQKVQGSTAIMRTLESIQPEPSLFPSDPSDRERVTLVEEWADDEIQKIARRLSWTVLSRSPQSMSSYTEGERLPVPGPLRDALARPVALVQSKLNKASSEQAERDLARLAEVLDRLDAYIEEGVIGGEEPNAADFQVGASLALMMTWADLRPLIETRPSGELADRLFPDYPGHVDGGVLPDGWLHDLRGGRGSTRGRPDVTRPPAREEAVVAASDETPAAENGSVQDAGVAQAAAAAASEHPWAYWAALSEQHRN